MTTAKNHEQEKKMNFNVQRNYFCANVTRKKTRKKVKQQIYLIFP